MDDLRGLCRAEGLEVFAWRDREGAKGRRVNKQKITNRARAHKPTHVRTANISNTQSRLQGIMTLLCILKH